MYWWRIAMGTLLAPATGPLIYGVGMILGSGYPYIGPGYMEKHLLSTAALMALSYLVSIGLGVPIVASLYVTKKLTGLKCIAWAFVAGAAAGVVMDKLASSAGSEFKLSQMVFLSAAFAALATLTAWVFCLIAGLRMRKPATRDA